MKVSFKNQVMNFEDEYSDLSIEHKRIKTKDYQKILAFISSSGGDQSKFIESLADEKTIELMKDIFPRYIVSINGIEVEGENGEPRAIAIDEIIEDGELFKSVATPFLTGLISSSSLSEEEAKKAKKK